MPAAAGCDAKGHATWTAGEAYAVDSLVVGATCEKGVALLVVVVLVAISSDPSKVLFGLFVLYGISGYIVYAWRKIKGKPVSAFCALRCGRRGRPQASGRTGRWLVAVNPLALGGFSLPDGL